VLAVALAGATGPPGPPPDDASQPPLLRQLADDAATTLTTQFYAGAGRWRACLDPSCGSDNVDWGSDSLTGVLYERRLLTGDDALLPIFRELEATEPHYGPCRAPSCTSWSDVPMWDAVAALRSYDVTHDDDALRAAEAAYASVAESNVFARGACPEIDYQRPHAESGGLKTLETDANATLAAVLLSERTQRAAYLDQARRRYDAIRHWFLDPQLALYTVYVFDDGRTCAPLPHRFFASVNGLMIEAGLELARATGDDRYAHDARATAQAIRALDDDRGIFTDLQAENDVVEPLVLAMLALARGGDTSARDWIVRNAAAAAHARRASDGAYGRFFDGPPPRAIVTAWQSNGGLALEIAAGALAPHDRAEPDNPWRNAKTIDIAKMRPTDLPGPAAQNLPFTGSGVALFGTLGESCCELGRMEVLLDGRRLVDRTGIWQNKSSAGRALPDTLLFAWRWRAAGSHAVSFGADASNAKEGGAFLHLRSMLVTR
jgi:hypothetical protein